MVTQNVQDVKSADAQRDPEGDGDGAGAEQTLLSDCGRPSKIPGRRTCRETGYHKGRFGSDGILSFLLFFPVSRFRLSDRPVAIGI